MRTSSLFPLALVTLATGCGHDDMDMMADHGALLDQHARATEADLLDHAGAIDRAESLDQVWAEEESHDGRMADHATAMTHEMGDMMGCMEDEHSELDEMWDAMGLMGEERRGHLAAMNAATSLAAARQEETSHQERMSGFMGQMRDDLTSMMDGAGEMSCPHHR